MLFSVVIPTYNSKNYILSCLDSLFLHNTNPPEVIVVDNGSSDETVALVKKSYPAAVVIENPVNLGACAARNQGVAVAHGSWVLTLDCDVVLKTGFLLEAGSSIAALDEDVAVVQPKVMMSDRERIYSCGIHLSAVKRFYDIGRGRYDRGQYEDNRTIFGACCAAAFYRKTILEEARDEFGYFDERFFFLVEDVDLAWRIKRKNRKAVFCPRMVCFHAGNASATGSAVRQFLCFRNRKLMIAKNENLIGRIRIALTGFWYDIPRTIYLFIVNPLVRKQTAKQGPPY